MVPDKLFDRYVWQTRVVTFLITVLPISFVVVIWLPSESLGWRLASGLISLILLSLFSQLGRDAGKKLEPRLFELWGGRPSIRKLRYRDTDLNWITLEQVRTKAAFAVGIPNPTQLEEQTDAACADVVYDAFVCAMRESTRDDSILLSENISYGMRRNLLGLRWAGAFIAFFGLLASACTAVWLAKPPEAFVPAVIATINAALLVWWLVRVNSNWVKLAAEAYADRLVKAYLASPSNAKTSSAA